MKVRFPHTRRPKIFISYRRDDSEADTDFLYEQLVRYFGTDHVFMDIDNIPVGRDFVEVIESAVSSCDVLIAVIGKQWLAISDGEKRRIDNSDDFVRLEIAAALRQNIIVIPLLVRGAPIPRQNELPDDLKSMARRHAFVISRVRRREDVEQLMTEIKLVAPKQSPAARTQPQAAPDQPIIVTEQSGTAPAQVVGVRVGKGLVMRLGATLLLIAIIGAVGLLSRRYLLSSTGSTAETAPLAVDPNAQLVQPLNPPTSAAESAALVAPTPITIPSATATPSPTAKPTPKRPSKPRPSPKKGSQVGGAFKKLKKILNPF
jgi:hypothetical protein